MAHKAALWEGTQFAGAIGEGEVLPRGESARCGEARRRAAARVCDALRRERG